MWLNRLNTFPRCFVWNGQRQIKAELCLGQRWVNVCSNALSNTDKQIYVRCLENRRVQMGVVPDSASWVKLSVVPDSASWVRLSMVPVKASWVKLSVVPDSAGPKINTVRDSAQSLEQRAVCTSNSHLCFCVCFLRKNNLAQSRTAHSLQIFANIFAKSKIF